MQITRCEVTPRFSSSKRFGNKIFLCRGEPTYTSPLRQQKDITKNLFTLKNVKKRSNKDIYLKNNLELALKRLYETNASITLLDQQEA